ncbi:MAG: isoprenylcysteine carboxylmethyltransferase family protein [Theionarchaea archaeon]|nr:isoprenylcysteine carboxylmethyltransferase family protein [Theionarchaea archaeon]
MKKNENKSSEGIGWKAIIRFVIYLLLMPLVLFIAAGTLHWTMGWIFVVLSYAFTGASRIIVFRKNPEMLKERARYMDAENVKDWDRAILLFAALLGPLVIYIVAGLDFRFSWSPYIPILIQLLALIGVFLGYLLGGWAMVVNKFFSAVARIQREQSQTVVSNGPYRFVRHPGYAGGILAMLSTPIMLGSLWALLPGGLVISLTIVRTFFEDTMLHDELDGYKEYSKMVKFRLLPGVW